jgi:outer membrane receptor protein involved in Fe transport
MNKSTTSFAGLRSIRNTALSSAIASALALGAADVAVGQEDVLDEIVVTGSRIVRRDFVSTSPIVTVESAAFEQRTNIGIESALNQFPQFAAAGTQSMRSGAGTPFPEATAAPGAATLNLRGLGTNRNLILVDGKRVQPVNGALVVDVNTIPSAAIESVEIITGGAAAVYGADAISGVVNFKLKKNFAGLEFDAQYGATQQSDGQELQISGLFGANMDGDRGNVMVGFNYARRDEVKGKDRDFVRAGWDDPNTDNGGLGSSNLSFFNQGTTNLPTAGFNPAGEIYGIDQNGNIFNSNAPMDPAHPYTGPLGGSSGFQINPNGTLAFIDKENSFLQVPLDRYSIFASANYEVTDKIEAFADARFSETTTTAIGFVPQFFNIWSPTIPFDPLYDDPNSPQFGNAPPGVARHPVSAELGALLSSRPNPSADWVYQGGLDYQPPFKTVTTSNVNQFIVGLRGDMDFRDWSWEIFGSHGNSTILAAQPEGFVFLPRSQELFSADMYGRGFTASYPIAVTGRCETGLPIFNEDGSVNDTPSISRDCSDYITLRMNNLTSLEQNVYEGNIQGTVVELPAGPLQFAGGVAYREEHFEFQPDTGFNANQRFPDVVGNIALPVGVDGKTDVSETYVEFAIPLLRDKPLIQSLSIDPGYRYSDYNTAGGVDTYKIMLDWQVNDTVRVRGGVQQANRAANVAELFTPVGGSQLQFGAPDTCGSWPQGPTWGNLPGNPNRESLQILCQHLMVRDGAPPSIYVPGEASADNYQFNVFGAPFFFPLSLAVTGGNTALQSETADTVTVGFVLDSPFDAPITISFDYYKIEIADAIGVPDHSTVYQQCMDAQYNSFIGDAPGSHSGAEIAANNPFCALIEREYIGDGLNDWGADRRFKAAYINQGQIVSEGYDIQANWMTDLAGGVFGLSFVASFLEQYAEAPFPGADLVDYTGTMTNTSFDYQTLTSFSYSKGPFSVGLRWQYLPSLVASPGSSSDVQGVAAYQQIDAFGRWSVGTRYELRAGIDNLTDAQPKVVGASSTDANLGSSINAHDIFGRRFYMAAKVRF